MKSITSTSARSSWFRSLPRWCRSSSTTTRTALSWARTCSASRCLCSKADAPIVGTGMEGVTARDSGAVVLARRNGIIDSVDSERIIVRVEGEHHPTQFSREVGSDIYQLTKFKRSNQNTCINQRPIVKKGDRVLKGQVIADGPCTENGRAGSRTQRAGGLHAMARLQLRRRHPGQREAGERGLLHLVHIEEFETRSARHQARSGRSHA